jgi:hypothetical protein
MEISEITKRASTIKKTEGTPYALEFLINSFNETWDYYTLKTYFDKLNTYFKKDDKNLAVRAFYQRLIDTRIFDEHSPLLSDYYWILKDYETYKLTVLASNSLLNINDPFQYLSGLNSIESNLQKYYSVTGLEKRQHAIAFLFSLIASEHVKIGKSLMMFDSHFFKYHSYLRWGHEMKPHFNYDFIKWKESISDWFKGKAPEASQCLLTLNSKLSNDEVVELIQNKLFNELPTALGFKFSILMDDDAKANFDIKSFCLSSIKAVDFKDILVIDEQIKEWRNMVLEITLDKAYKEPDLILEKIMG